MRKLRYRDVAQLPGITQPGRSRAGIETQVVFLQNSCSQASVPHMHSAGPGLGSEMDLLLNLSFVV